MKKAVLVIDMQNFCVGSEHASFFRYDETIVNRVNRVRKWLSCDTKYKCNWYSI